MRGKSLKYFFLGAAIVAVGVWGLAVTIPNSFSAGDVISAAKINANFAAIKAAVDALESAITGKQNRVTGTCVGGQALTAVAADGTVTCGGSPSAWALIQPNGTVFSHSNGVTWTITKVGTGEYCMQTSPNLFGNFAPVLATIHGPDKTFGQISVNTEYGSDCNPYGGHGVFTANSSGTPTDQWFLVTIF
jgi:hypothetical protein